jgi:hypothetical protein
MYLIEHLEKKIEVYFIKGALYSWISILKNKKDIAHIPKRWEGFYIYN